MIWFTKEELERLKTDQLRRLCKYYDIEVFKSWNKKKLIQVILEYFCPPGYTPIEELGLPENILNVSERVRRIYQSIHNKGENL